MPLSTRQSPRAAAAPCAPIVWFFVLAYALSWTWWIALAASGRLVERGDAWPTQIPGLLGPMLAALIVLTATEGGPGVRRWLAAMVRVPRTRRWQLAAVAPLGFLVFGLLVAAAIGEPPRAEEFLHFSGTAATVPALLAALVVSMFGEESGWRGYALSRLQTRLDALRATLVLTAAWAGWHLPLFFLLASYQDFGPFTMIGFVVGLTAGALVLTSIFNWTGGSILAVALWHGTYNLSVATTASDGVIGAIVTACVIFWGVSLLRARRAGQPVLGPAVERAAGQT